jgi:hypothetical protein
MTKDIHTACELVKQARHINFQLYQLDQQFSSLILQLGNHIKDNPKLRSQLKANGWSNDCLDTLLRATSNNPKDFDYEAIIEAISSITLPLEL